MFEHCVLGMLSWWKGKTIKVRQPLGPSALRGSSSRCQAGSCHSLGSVICTVPSVPLSPQWAETLSSAELGMLPSLHRALNQNKGWSQHRGLKPGLMCLWQLYLVPEGSGCHSTSHVLGAETPCGDGQQGFGMLLSLNPPTGRQTAP